MSPNRKFVARALAALALFTAFDHGMRVDWARKCMIETDMQCPDRLWWFARGCETDGECEAIAGPFLR